MKVNLYLGDNLINLKKLEDNSIDAVVCDPPYGLKFMGKKWDYDVPSTEFWNEVYRVLNPGGHILSFGGTRTYHRLVVNCEDAGFEVRDCISWIYGQGFPKSHNIGKSIDKKLGNEREFIMKNPFKASDEAEIRTKGKSIMNRTIHADITKGSSAFEGWGSALKPAQELILLARKPLSEGTIAENVLKWGTGGLNIDGSRIGTDLIISNGKKNDGGEHIWGNGKGKNSSDYHTENEGRFPANIIFDEEAAKLLDEQSGISGGGSIKYSNLRQSNSDRAFIKCNNKNIDILSNTPDNYGDEGGASRYFKVVEGDDVRFRYCAKVSKKERNLGCENILSGSTHPTVKPIKLMTYLCRLITPTDGTILDPFMGSGSTGVAALLEGFNFIGMEMDEGYMEIAKARIKAYKEYKKIIK